MEYSIRLIKINANGYSIDSWIDVPNLVILDGWCNVLHQSTEYFIIGILIKPTKHNIDEKKGPF